MVKVLGDVTKTAYREIHWRKTLLNLPHSGASHLSSYSNKPQAAHALGSCQQTTQMDWKNSAGKNKWGTGTDHAEHYTWPRTTCHLFLPPKESRCLLSPQKQALPFGLARTQARVWGANPIFVLWQDSLEQPGGCCWLAPVPSWCSAAACSPLLHPPLTYPKHLPHPKHLTIGQTGGRSDFYSTALVT